MHATGRESRISVEFVRLTVMKSFLQKPSRFQKTSGIQSVNGWEGGYQVFPSNVFSQVIKKFHCEHFCVSKNFCSRKDCMDERRDYQVFASKIFCLTLPKTFFANNSLFQKNSGSENFLRMPGGYHVFPSNFFDPHYRKISLGTLRCFRKSLAAKTIHGC